MQNNSIDIKRWYPSPYLPLKKIGSPFLNEKTNASQIFEVEKATEVSNFKSLCRNDDDDDDDDNDDDEDNDYDETK